MSYVLECRKIKRTGLIPAFLCGGLITALIPILNMAFRSEIYIFQSASPLQILLDANWQMMAMLNMLLVISGACVMYHIEYADNAIQRISALPFHESHLYLGKALVLTILGALSLFIEIMALAFCGQHWFFSGIPSYTAFCAEILANYGYLLLLMLPVILLSLLIASACRNLWISLGINVICIFTATMLPAKNLILSLFPFALPFQTWSRTDIHADIHFMVGAVIEIGIIGIVEWTYLKIRRCFR